MELSGEAMEIMYQAMEYARSHSYEYVTPEIVLLMILKDKTFSEAFEECGGNIGALGDYLKEYANEYVDRSDKNDPELSAGTNMLLSKAGASAYNSGAKEIYIRHMVHGSRKSIFKIKREKNHNFITK